MIRMRLALVARVDTEKECGPRREKSGGDVKSETGLTATPGFCDRTDFTFDRSYVKPVQHSLEPGSPSTVSAHQPETTEGSPPGHHHGGMALVRRDVNLLIPREHSNS